MNRTLRNARSILLPPLGATLAGAGIALLAAAPSTAYAQTASDGTLEEIIVTAQRREQNLQSTPVAISAYSGDVIENNRIFSATDLAAYSSSLSMTAGTPLDQEMNIRGVTNTRLDSPTADPSVGLFFDDIYIGRTGDMNVDFYDIGRIEVIRGPQGVLLGKNVVGGALSVYPRLPTFENSGEIMVSTGSYDAFEASGWINGGLTDELAGRFSFQSRTRDGYAYDVLNDRELENLDSRQFRAQLAYEPGDSNFRARLSVDYNKDSSNGIATVVESDGLPVSAANSTFRPWSALRAFLGLTDPRVTTPEYSRYAGEDFDRQQYFHREGEGIGLYMDWDFEGATLSSITGYRGVRSGLLYDQSGAGPDLFDNGLNDFAEFMAFAATRDLGLGAILLFSEPVREDTEVRQISQEIRLTSNNGGALDWIVGAYYKHDKVDKLDRFFGESITGALPTLSGESHWDNRGELDSLAAFAQVGYQFNDAWRLAIGGRYTRDEKSGFVDGIAVATGDRFTPGDTAPLTPLASPFSVSYGDSWSEFTPQGILEFQPNESWYFYGSVSTGFKGGGYEDTPANGVAAGIAYDPELVTNYEVGFKSTLLEQRLRLNVTAFFMDYQDLQVQQTNQDCLCNITDNASDAEIQGIEAELHWLVSPDFLVFASGSMLDTEYVDFIENSGVDSSGNKLQRTPENQFSAGFDWSVGPGKLKDALSWNVMYSWQDEFYWQPANTNLEDAYGLWNTRLTYLEPDASWSVSVWVKNATDELYRTNTIPLFGELAGQYGAPRTYGIDLRLQF